MAYEPIRASEFSFNGFDNMIQLMQEKNIRNESCDHRYRLLDSGTESMPKDKEHYTLLKATFYCEKCLNTKTINRMWKEERKPMSERVEVE